MPPVILSWKAAASGVGSAGIAPTGCRVIEVFDIWWLRGVLGERSESSRCETENWRVFRDLRLEDEKFLRMPGREEVGESVRNSSDS